LFFFVLIFTLTFFGRIFNGRMDHVYSFLLRK
jgi:hypothetical protein